MSASQLFLLSPLSRALRLLPFLPFLIISEQAQAIRFIDGSLEPEASIDGTTPQDKYSVFNGATLNAVDAHTLDITVKDSTLSLTGTGGRYISKRFGMALIQPARPLSSSAVIELQRLGG